MREFAVEPAFRCERFFRAYFQGYLEGSNLQAIANKKLVIQFESRAPASDLESNASRHGETAGDISPRIACFRQRSQRGPFVERVRGRASKCRMRLDLLSHSWRTADHCPQVKFCH